MSKDTRSPFFQPRLLIAIVLLVLSLASCAQRSRVLLNPEPISVNSASVAERKTDVRTLIRTALRDYEWGIEQDKPGLLIAKQTRGEFSARIKISYDSRNVRVAYVDSDNLLYQVDEQGTPRIHGRYNTWVANVVRRITALVQ